MGWDGILYLYLVWWWPGFLHTQDQHGWPRGQVHPQPDPSRCWDSDCRPGGDLLLEEVCCPPLYRSTGLPLHDGDQWKEVHFSCVSHLIGTVLIMCKQDISLTQGREILFCLIFWKHSPSRPSVEVTFSSVYWKKIVSFGMVGLLASANTEQQKK